MLELNNRLRHKNVIGNDSFVCSLVSTRIGKINMEIHVFLIIRKARRLSLCLLKYSMSYLFQFHSHFFQ